MPNTALMHRLLDGLDPGEGWLASFTLGDQTQQLARLTHDLQAPFSPDGNGKSFPSGFLYMGAEPTLAWAKASGDLYYPVMKTSIETTARRWAQVRHGLASNRCHYVSLGPGTGQKDELILRDLDRAGEVLSYVPVDMSDDMIRLAVRQIMLDGTVTSQRIVPVQLDFCQPDNVRRLKALLHGGVGDEPILFSLLGNTLANSLDDEALLADLAALLRPQDRLLLEVATTEALGEDLAVEAAAEYAGTQAFREFVTSALLYHTDLAVRMDSVVFEGLVERDRALLVKAYYRNDTGGGLRIMLPDRTRVGFPAGDTVRLNITRKYLRRCLAPMLGACGLESLGESRWSFSTRRGDRAFGMSLFLLGLRGGTPPVSSLAEAIWRQVSP